MVQHGEFWFVWKQRLMKLFMKAGFKRQPLQTNI